MPPKLLLPILCAAATVSAAASQKPAEEPSPLDRIVVEQPGGGPWLLTPAVPTFSEKAPLAVGKAAGVVVGFELAPGIVSHGPIGPELQAQIKTRERISLAGKTVREALDAIVAVDPRYHWVDVHGVPVVRPRKAWVDPFNPLNRVGGPIDWHEVSLDRALSLLVAGLRGQTEDSGRPIPGDDRSRTFSLRLETAGLLEMLNEIAKAHGRVVWEVGHECIPANVKNRPAGDDLQVGFTSFDGGSSLRCFVIPPPPQDAEPR